jgi:hypothetical protein
MYFCFHLEENLRRKANDLRGRYDNGDGYTIIVGNILENISQPYQCSYAQGSLW